MQVQFICAIKLKCIDQRVYNINIFYQRSIARTFLKKKDIWYNQWFKHKVKQKQNIGAEYECIKPNDIVSYIVDDDQWQCQQSGNVLH
jgi:hypothetical protein